MKTGEPLLDNDAELHTRKGAPREMSLDDNHLRGSEGYRANCAKQFHAIQTNCGS